jgi:RNA polymerase sigma factor (sigma-70 family)
VDPISARHRGLRCGTRVQLRPMGTDDDGELMLRYASGDMRAFETLYRRHKSALYRYLTRQTRNTETANDLFQEVWSKIIVSRERYEPRAQFRTFLYRIAHNCFIDYCRRSSVRNESNGGDDGWESMLPGSEQDRPAMSSSCMNRGCRSTKSRPSVLLEWKLPRAASAMPWRNYVPLSHRWRRHFRLSE